MISKKLIRMNVSDLVPYENNPRRNEDAIAVVVESIRQCENIDPIEVDENNVILSGHTRRLALMQTGILETDVIVVDGLTEEQKKKYRILANKTAEFSGWDFEKLQVELDGLDFDGFDFSLFDEQLTEDSPTEDRKEICLSDRECMIIVDCENENDMKEKFDLIEGLGIECRTSML